tara:strand:+ start:140 stop:739 length:600 start_codon:yes stop_codon:yes gene_type:complete
MKIFIAVIILIFGFQSLTKANDISEFEIEGMSIGGSLLDFMSRDLIIKEKNNKDFSFYYKDDYISISTWEIRKQFEIYNNVGVILKAKDNQFKIYGLEGVLYMGKDSDIKECHKKQNEITNDIKDSLNLKSNGEIWIVPKEQLQAHQLSIKYIDFELKGGGAIRTTCFEIKPGVRKNSDTNLLYVVVNSPEFWKYLDTY